MPFIFLLPKVYAAIVRQHWHTGGHPHNQCSTGLCGNECQYGFGGHRRFIHCLALFRAAPIHRGRRWWRGGNAASKFAGTKWKVSKFMPPILYILIMKESITLMNIVPDRSTIRESPPIQFVRLQPPAISFWLYAIIF